MLILVTIRLSPILLRSLAYLPLPQRNSVFSRCASFLGDPLVPMLPPACLLVAPCLCPSWALTYRGLHSRCPHRCPGRRHSRHPPLVTYPALAAPPGGVSSTSSGDHTLRLQSRFFVYVCSMLHSSSCPCPMVCFVLQTGSLFSVSTSRGPIPLYSTRSLPPPPPHVLLGFVPSVSVSAVRSPGSRLLHGGWWPGAH